MYKDRMSADLSLNDSDLACTFVDQSKDIFDWSISYVETLKYE
jgi:hypothetical protein